MKSASDYKNAIAYLDRCGRFDEHKLREMNRIVGDMLSETEIQGLVRQSQMIMPTATSPGGMEFIRSSIRDQMLGFIQIAESSQASEEQQAPPTDIGSIAQKMLAGQTVAGAEAKKLFG